MKKKTFCLIIILFMMYSIFSIGEKNIIGFWKSIDDTKGFTTSIIVTYLYQDMLYGRVIVSFDEETGNYIECYQSPSKIAYKVDKNPLLLDIDIFFDLTFDGEKYIGGYVIDPRSGKTYHAEVWTTKDGLIIRGKFGPFGMKNLFLSASEKDFPSNVEIPNISIFSPYIPR